MNASNLLGIGFIKCLLKFLSWSIPLYILLTINHLTLSIPTGGFVDSTRSCPFVRNPFMLQSAIHAISCLRLRAVPANQVSCKTKTYDKKILLTFGFGLQRGKKFFCLIYYLSKGSCSPSYFTRTFFLVMGLFPATLPSMFILLVIVFVLTCVSRIILVYYCKCCNLIGYSIRYLFLDR